MNPSPTPSTQERESALFALALEKPLTERSAFLQAVCGKDNVLRQRLEALLAAHDQPDNLVPAPAEAVRPTIKLDLADAPDEAVGQTLGRYKLPERVGEGGCGVVYVAEQTEPVRRRVALKVIKLGMDTKQVVARFEAERQALAMMDHPNIAKVLDAGTTDDDRSADFSPQERPRSEARGTEQDVISSRASLRTEVRASFQTGRPFFVMELVRGIRITDYCDQANLATKERLDLFIKVCQAIQHAHQKGITHRDIKPSNILVTLHDGVPVPKVIDFGIAKATEGRLTDNTVYTQLHQFIGTPAYMSPEQAEMSGLDIDTRSDIYSLGVLLYELLAGSTPFDAKELMASGIEAMRKTIRDKEPQRPSTRLATLGADQLTTTAKRRSADTSKLLHQLKGDLDWIVMKCLEKDRQRRYETANGLAADLKRHLNNEPVLARPPSAAYKFQKAWRRNKLVFAAGGVVVVGLLIGLAALSFALVRERALKSESARADSIAKFVTGMLNDAVPRLNQQGDSTGIKVLLDSADKLVPENLTNSPAAEMTVRTALMYFYGGMIWDNPNCKIQADRIVSLLPLVTDDRLPPAHTRDDPRMDVAELRLWSGEGTQERAPLDKLAEEFKQRGPAGNRALARTLAKLGNGLRAMNKLEEGEPLLREAYQLNAGRIGPGFYWEDFAGQPYSHLLIRNGKYSEAEKVARDTVIQINAELGKEGPWKIWAEFNASMGWVYCYTQLVDALCRLGRFEEAKRLVAEQLGPGAAHAWSPPQLKTFKALQLTAQAYSGDWVKAAPGLVVLATDKQANVRDWGNGVVAAFASGDTKEYDRLCRWGWRRYAGNARADTANTLFWGLILRPREEDLSDTLPELLRRVAEGKEYSWTVVNLLFMSSQLAYRRGEYEEALRLLNEWIQFKDGRSPNVNELYFMRASAMPDFWRAMILARLDRAKEAAKAYGDGAQKLRAGLPINDEDFTTVWYFYNSQALRQEAREVLRSQGIAVPDTETTP